MSLRELIESLDRGRTGTEMHALVAELYPICRSITGDGFRETLDLLERVVPLQRSEVPTGTAVLDWTVPREWNVREAWLRGPDGRTIADVRAHTLHLVSYSVPFRGTVSLAELQGHLHSLPDQPDRIPYRTSYYAEDWGFCVPDRVRVSLPDGDYEVCVDTTLGDGALTYAEHVVPGTTPR
jgi:aminopeptidase-like protein